MPLPPDPLPVRYENIKAPPRSQTPAKDPKDAWLSYPEAVTACIAHGVMFSASVWFSAQAHSATASEGFYRAAQVLLFTWPIWAIILARLSRSWIRTLLPLFFGALASAPGAFVWAVLSSMGSSC